MAQDEGLDAQETRKWYKSPRFYAITVAPALIAGIFSLGPTALEKISAPKAEITYETIESPSVITDRQYTSILSTTITNTGTTKLNSVEVSLRANAGRLVNVSVRDAEEEVAAILPDQYGARVVARSMFPSEGFTVSALYISDKQAARPQLSVRSNEVVGKSKLKNKKEQIDPSLWWAMLSAFAVLLYMGALLPKFLSKLQPPKFHEGLKESKPILKAFTGPNNDMRPAVARLISEKLNSKFIKKSIDGRGNNLAYLQIGEIVYGDAIRKWPINRRKHINALKAILLYPLLTEETGTKIVRLISLLGGSLELDVIRQVATTIESQEMLLKEVEMTLISENRF